MRIQALALAFLCGYVDMHHSHVVSRRSVLLASDFALNQSFSLNNMRVHSI